MTHGCFTISKLYYIQHYCNYTIYVSFFMFLWILLDASYYISSVLLYCFVLCYIQFHSLSLYICILSCYTIYKYLLLGYAILLYYVYFDILLYSTMCIIYLRQEQFTGDPLSLAASAHALGLLCLCGGLDGWAAWGKRLGGWVEKRTKSMVL